jgi:hypothetical protein
VVLAEKKETSQIGEGFLVLLRKMIYRRKMVVITSDQGK